MVAQVESRMEFYIYLVYRRARKIPPNRATAPFLCNATFRQ